MRKTDFSDYICRPYCMFFKPGQKEEMACRGARAVESLVAGGRISADGLAGYRKDPDVWRKYDARFAVPLCQPCEFRAEDCEFREASPPADAEPCGGFILLALLREDSRIDDSDIEALAWL